jgi:dTDP-4-dehydrorhamnose reductase
VADRSAAARREGRRGHSARSGGALSLTQPAATRILVTGARGQLGLELAAALAPYGSVTALDRAALDLESAPAVRSTLERERPTLIVNAAAYTAVDQAETDRARAFAVNADAPALMAEHARASGALLVHYSTDYVFDGAQREPYDEDAPTNPLNVYGASKRAGEEAIAASGAHALVLRTSWVYGMRGRNFLLTIRRLAASRDELRIVADQTGVPNWCRELARATARLVARGLPFLAERSGLYHLSASGATTWYDFARAIVGNGDRPRMVPIATSDYPTPARRPAYGVLSTLRFTRTFGFALPDWRRSLAECMAASAEPEGSAAAACPPSRDPER